MIWPYWDKGTKRATLALYRNADPDRLAIAGKDLDKLSCPALVLWGDRDLFLPAKFGLDHASALSQGEREIVEGAGHWPCIDDQRVIDRIATFIG